MTHITLGKWTLGNAYNCARNHAICNGPMVIARVLGNGYPAGLGWSHESEANARLMSAAPELLNALDAAVCHIERMNLTAESNTITPESELDYMRAAIKKAEGE